MAAGRPGALSLHSAGGLWAMTRPCHGAVHAVGSRSRRGDGWVVHRSRHLPRSDVTRQLGIPVTTPLRTLLDLSPVLSLDALDAALAEALVRRLVTVDDLRPRAIHSHRRAFESDRELT